jgi:hypothetical protein
VTGAEDSSLEAVADPLVEPVADPSPEAVADPSVEPVETTVPFLRVVKGDPTPDELAALVAVLASLGGPVQTPAPPATVWNAPRRLHRVVHPYGAGGWRASGLPR